METEEMELVPAAAYAGPFPGNQRNPKERSGKTQPDYLRKNISGFGSHCCCEPWMSGERSSREIEETHPFLCWFSETSLHLVDQASAPASSPQRNHGFFLHLCSEATPCFWESNLTVEDRPPLFLMNIPPSLLRSLRTTLEVTPKKNRFFFSRVFPTRNKCVNL